MARETVLRDAWNEDDDDRDRELRPQRMADVIGQRDVFARLMPRVKSLQSTWQYYLALLPSWHLLLGLEERALAAGSTLPAGPEEEVALGASMCLRDVTVRFDGQEGTAVADSDCIGRATDGGASASRRVRTSNANSNS